ncbi:MAG: sulfatase-like hydrolase/transferase [Rikenellaceae bacterium]
MRNFSSMNILLLAGVVPAMQSCAESAPTKSASAEKPNVIVVLCDDLGSYDVGFGGCKDIPTPNIDRIAHEGINCTDAKISAPYSGPSRCGLLTGRYQQRFGAEGNTEDHSESVDQKQGVPTTETMMPEAFKAAGYKTAVIGKWHAGDNETMTPNARGADYFYGMTGGGFSFWGIPAPKAPTVTIMENDRNVPASEVNYLTDDFTDKALDFIDKNADENFMIYLAYNAPHAPMQAPQKYLDRTTHIFDPWRTIYAAMVLAVDDGVGKVWAKLEEKGIADNTIIIFLSDNGGTNRAYNIPRRAYKGNMFDGGISTPFAIYWKNGGLTGGKVYDKTISSLDIFPTVAAAAGIDSKSFKNPLDGVDLMPYWMGEKRDAPHKALFWRVCGGMEYAARMGDYKIVKRYHSDDLMLFNIAKDPIEMYDIAAENPAKVKELAVAYDKWNSEMMTPRWEDKHAPHQIEDYENWTKARKRALRPQPKKNKK